MSIRPIKDNLFTPKILANGVKWDELEHALVVAIQKDGNVLITSSYMKDRELAYLSAQLQAFVMRYFSGENKRYER